MQLRGRTPGGDAWATMPALDPHVLRDVRARVPSPLIGWRAPPPIVQRSLHVAAPAYQASGTAVSGVFSDASPAWPTHAINDVAILFVFQAEGGNVTPVVPTLSVPAGFARGSLPTVTGIDGAFSITVRMTAFYCRATSTSMSAPTVTDSASTRMTCIIITFRGCITTGDPVDTTSTAGSAASGTSISIGGSSTTGPTRLIVAGAGANFVGTFSSWASTAAASFTKIGTDSNPDAATISTAAGTLAVSGSYGTASATIASSVPWSGIQFALMPPAAAQPGSIPTARSDGRVWLKPGFGNVTRGSTEQNNGVPGSVPAPGFVARPVKPWLKPGFGALVKGSTQPLGAGVDAPPNPSPLAKNPRPWLKPGQFALVKGSTVNQLPVGVRGASYWGPHFPRRRATARTFWNGHFPDGIPNTVPGVNPPGVGTFALTLESGAKVAYAWRTGLFKSYSGKERRSNIIDDPAQRFEGTAILVGKDTRAARSRLARYAALGSAFLLGLPYESLAIAADSTGTTVTVATTALSDWAVPGCRVVVRRATAAGLGGVTFDSVDAVIQSVTATTIVVDVTLGNVGLLGGEIMPAVAVYLDAQQAFARYRTPDAIERWNVKARNVNPGFLRSATWAQLALADVARTPAEPSTAAAAASALGMGTFTHGWKLNETSGDVAPAFGGITGVAGGTPTYANAGPLGIAGQTAVGFDSGTDAFSFGDNFDFSGTEDLIVSWIGRFPSPPPFSYGTMFTKASVGFADGWAITATDGAAGLYFLFGPGAATSSILPTTNFFPGQWHVGIAAIDRSTATMRIGFRSLADGTAQLGPLTSGVPATGVAIADSFTIGNSPWVPAQNPFQVAALYIGKGTGNAQGVPANLSTALANFATAVTNVPRSTNLDGIVFRALSSGTSGNAKTVQFVDDPSGPYAVVTGNALVYHFRAGVDTVATMMGAVERTDFCYVTGPRPNTVMTVDDVFGPVALSGGVNAGPVPVGVGATVTTFSGIPVWDRRLDDPDTVTDTIQSFAQAQDLGGLSFMAGMTSIADWGRDITLVAQLGAEWQWVKKFLDTVRARWKSFWLPTWRKDLISTASGAGTLTITSGENYGDFFAWYPAQRSYLQIWQADGTVTYARISAAVDNGNGTITLSIVDAASGAITLSGSAIAMVSWLERVRLEDDTVAVTFEDFNFMLHLTARVVQQAGEATPVATLLYDESGVETSQPREGIEIRINDLVVYRIATGTRDVTIGGVTFTAGPAQRGELGIAAVGDDDQALDVTLPLAHAVAQRYLAIGVPPKQILLNVWRKQTTSGAEETVWRGIVTSIAPGDHVVRMRVMSRMSQTISRRLPTVTAGRSCPHILYDANCKVDRASASTTTTVTGTNGRVVTVAVPIPTADFFTFGELVHSASGERMTIQQQIGSVITMQLPIYGMAIGDTVVLSPGCDHSISTCNSEFGNRDNFGGFPQLPKRNPFKNAKLGNGVVEQT